MLYIGFFFFKQKTAYEMRISDWSSDVCSSDLKRGIQLVPEERRIFGQITVQENLQLAAMTAEKSRTLDEIYETFPRLAERKRNRGKQLSGGEQQMLAIARAMIRNANIIMLDEPFEGLPQLIVRDLIPVCRNLAESGNTIGLVE